MPDISKYKLFVSTECYCCDKVLSHLENEKITIPTINIDKNEYDLPFRLMIFPALIREKELLSYGCDDIIAHLKTI